MFFISASIDSIKTRLCFNNNKTLMYDPIFPGIWLLLLLLLLLLSLLLLLLESASVAILLPKCE